jgi:hypothetical protein
LYAHAPRHLQDDSFRCSRKWGIVGMEGGSHQGRSESQSAVSIAETPNALLIINYKNWW